MKIRNTEQIKVKSKTVSEDFPNIKSLDVLITTINEAANVYTLDKIPIYKEGTWNRIQHLQILVWFPYTLIKY